MAQPKIIKVHNRSDGTVTYNLPELNIRRVFNINESKDVQERELKALWQLDGGAELIKHYLMVDDEEWVRANWPDAPIEYFWNMEKIKQCVLEDTVDLFAETLDFAPRGVVDLIKYLAWKLPLTDLNKINVIQEKLGFNVQAAIQIMSENNDNPVVTNKERKRRREG